MIDYLLINRMNARENNKFLELHYMIITYNKTLNLIVLKILDSGTPLPNSVGH